MSARALTFSDKLRAYASAGAPLTLTLSSEGARDFADMLDNSRALARQHARLRAACERAEALNAAGAIRAADHQRKCRSVIGALFFILGFGVSLYVTLAILGWLG